MIIVQTVKALERTRESVIGDVRCALGGMTFRNHSGGGFCGCAAAESIACLIFVISPRGTCVATNSTHAPSAAMPTEPTPMTQLDPRVSGRPLRLPTAAAIQIESIAISDVPNVTTTDPTPNAIPPRAAARRAFLADVTEPSSCEASAPMTPIARVCISR